MRKKSPEFEDCLPYIGSDNSATTNQRPAFELRSERSLCVSDRQSQTECSYALSVADEIHSGCFEAHVLSRITIAPGVSSRTPHATRRRVRPLEPPARGTTTEHHGGSRFRPLHAAPRAFRAVEGQGEARHQGEMRRARGVHGKQDRGRRRGGRPQGAPPRGTLLRVQLQGHPPPHQVRAKETRAAARDRGSALQRAIVHATYAKSRGDATNARYIHHHHLARMGAPDVLD
jgi:hypothetical protein